MKIQKIALKNLNSLKLDISIDFTEHPLLDAGLFAIVGDTGAGKTTVLDALTLGLYGRVHRNKDEGEVLSYGAIDGHAEVEFLVKDEIYRGKWVIWRSRGKVDGKINIKRELAKWNPKKEIFEILASKVREINEKVEAISGLDYERFSKSVLLSQGDFAAFLKAGDKERSNLLERITGTEVYSQISIAAFQKHKKEEQKINALKEDLDRLDILDPESLKSLKTARKDLLKESKEKQKTLLALQKQQQWRHRLLELENQQENYAIEVQRAMQKIELAATDFVKLNRHQKTIVFQKDLTKLEGLEINLNELQQEKGYLTGSIDNYRSQQAVFAQKSTTLALELKSLKGIKTEKEKIFQQVIALDVKLEEKNIPFQKKQYEKKEIDKQVAGNQIDVLNVENREEDGKKLIGQLDDWLNKHDKFKNVANSLPALRNLISDWSSIKGVEKVLRKEQEENEKSLQKEQALIAGFDEKIAQKYKELKRIDAHFFSQFSVAEPLDRGQLLENLSQELERLDGQAKNLEILIDLNEDYLTLINELTSYDVQILDLENKRGIIDGRFLTALEMEETMQKRYDYKLHIYEREKLFANYDRERAKLVEGEKCPLCFSTAHPFHTIKDNKPYVNEAEAEYLVVKAQLDLIKKETKKLLLLQNEISNQIKQIIGEQEKNLEGKRDLVLKRIKTAEAKIALIAPELMDENLYHIRKGDVLRQKMAIIKENLAHKRKQRRDLITLNQELIKLERSIAALQETYNEAKIKLTSVQNNAKNVTEKLTDILNQQGMLTQKIDKALRPFDYSIKQQEAYIILNTLDKKRIDFEKAIQKLNQETQTLALTKQELRQVKQQSKELEKRQTNIAKQVTTFKVEIDELKQKRSALFGNQEVEAERSKLNFQLEATEDSLSLINQQLKEAEIQLKSELAKAKKNEIDRVKIEQKLSKQRAQLLIKIQPKGFTTLAELKIANLLEKEVVELENLTNNLQKELTQAQQSLENTKKELATTIAKSLTTESLDTMEAKQEEIETASQYLQQEIGKITQQIEDNNRRKELGKELLQKMEIQQKEFYRWAKLKEIIGSADGKVFRAFAQGLTLKKLGELANRHLVQLNGRYLIHKPSNKDLALEIIDQHQANNIRSIHTLSGGESFLVSLALALGLSDLASRNTQIKSLFIDEGFGTLDESALDLAISTLENLQSKGKRIGVISHVTALKERIATQIQVQKRGSGFSELEIMG